MIGIDTNVLVRYLVQDDPAQSAAATEIIDNLSAGAPGFLSQVALVETVWVLARAYKMPRAFIAGTIDTLLRSPEITVEGAEAGHRALAVYRATDADFADALIAEAGRQAGCGETVTFDKKAAAATGMRLLVTAAS
ncbi:type II toxin-antitoxin system VapC family toxin [Zavarzinia compransoris]|uniref:PIN domain-containing protein n=1 Tax=Zavarzinia marina TaxID=2911065 RepID=UPI001F2A8802|nr:type II toxin-antitoxin system VapC family toxin [Zavarzinia marina]MCF4164338.1 type II toxin-antitoxin system VapC family toxin [Zavarzinia marina]